LLLFLVNFKQGYNFRQRLDSFHNIVDASQICILKKSAAYFLDDRQVIDLVARRHFNPLTYQVKDVLDFCLLHLIWLNREAD
jgi:hypothetical protein